jgi:hypothetical protein
MQKKKKYQLVREVQENAGDIYYIKLDGVFIMGSATLDIEKAKRMFENLKNGGSIKKEEIKEK